MMNPYLNIGILVIALYAASEVFLNIEVSAATEIDIDDIPVGGLTELYSPGTLETGFYYPQADYVWWLLSDDIYTDYYERQFYVFPTLIDLEECCDSVGLLSMKTSQQRLSSSHLLEELYYSGAGHYPYDPVSLKSLMALPTMYSFCGHVAVRFKTDMANELTGFAFRFIAFHKRWTVVPLAHTLMPAYTTTETVRIQPHVTEVSILTATTMRVKLNIVHMNYSHYEVLHAMQCQHQTERLEFFDTYCSMDNCFLAIMCRNPYIFTPITLVSHGYLVVVRNFCTQPDGTDCAFLNYKIYDPNEGPGILECVNMTTHRDYEQVSDFWALEHSWNASSDSSQMNKTWWIENTSPGEELLIQVMENEMINHPNCLYDKVEIYSGGCIDDANLVTYFCGGVMDTYKLTTSKFAAIKFTGFPEEVDWVIPAVKKIHIWIFAGAHDVSTPIFTLPTTEVIEERPQISIIRETTKSNILNDYLGLWVTLLAVGVFVTVGSMLIKRRYRKKIKKKIRRQMWPAPLYTGYTGTGIPPPAVYIPPPPREENETAEKKK